MQSNSQIIFFPLVFSWKSSSFISISEVRKNFSWVIDSLSEQGEKIIFRNNKPTAVLVDFTFYEKIQNYNNITVEDIKWSEEFIWTKQHSELLSLMKTA